MIPKTQYSQNFQEKEGLEKHSYCKNHNIFSKNYAEQNEKINHTKTMPAAKFEDKEWNADLED